MQGIKGPLSEQSRDAIQRLIAGNNLRQIGLALRKDLDMDTKEKKTRLADALLPYIENPDQSASEDKKIEALIQHVGDLKDTKFIRNGSEYGASTAAKFLRGKWDAHKAEVKTADDFITKVATASGTSGQPYLLRFKDGKELKSGDYLRRELRKLK